MTAILIANIGQRDLCLDSEALARTDAAKAEELRQLRENKKLRQWGHRIEKDYAVLEPHLDAPMLRSAAAALQARGDRIGRVILIATKQRDKAFMPGDTFTCAKVLTRWLPKHLSAAFGEAKMTVNLIEEPPHDMNAMLDAYARFCGGVTEGQVYALVTGGTPACNMALSLRAIEAFGERCVTLHVPEGGAEPLQLNVVKYVLDQHRRHALRRLVERGDFDAVAQDTGYPAPVRALARAAASRFNFNFAESLAALQVPELKDKLDPKMGMVAETRKLAQGSRPEVMREVYWNAVMKWRRAEYADFLGRAWRLLEASLYSAIARATGLPTKEKDFPEAFENWTELPEQQALKRHVHRKFRSKGQEPSRIRASIPALTCVLGFLAKELPQHRDEMEKLRPLAKRIRPLSELRNRCVIAHGFEGLSRGQILEEVKMKRNEDRILELLAELLKAQSIDPGKNHYEQYAAAVVELNEREG